MTHVIFFQMDGKVPQCWLVNSTRANPSVFFGSAKKSGEFAQSPGGTGAVLRALVRAAKRGKKR